MSNALNHNLPFLTPSDLLATASAIDATHTRTIKAIERLNMDVAAQKSAIANKWKTTPINSIDRQRIEAEEIRVVLLNIRKNAEKELDGLFIEAGTAHARAISQRVFYGSPVMTLNRITLGDPKRSAYLEQTANVGSAEAAHLGQLAVSTSNNALAAALVTRIDAMPVGSRPFNGVALAEAMQLDEHRKAVESLRIIEARFQGVVIAIRSWKADKSNPLNTVSLALMGRTLDETLLKEMEVADGAAAG
jgi:hypothetical protein